MWASRADLWTNALRGLEPPFELNISVRGAIATFSSHGRSAFKLEPSLHAEGKASE